MTSSHQRSRPRNISAIKDEANGTQRFKGRLVIKGYEQRYGEDFHETWASVATMASTRLLAAIGGQLGRKIYQMDVKNACLNADLDEAILTCLPEGFDDGSGDLLLLRKSLYGLKQAPRQWFLCIDAKLRSIGTRPQIHISVCIPYRRYCSQLVTAGLAPGRKASPSPPLRPNTEPVTVQLKNLSGSGAY
jgi:hypothetical protein